MISFSHLKSIGLFILLLSFSLASRAETTQAINFCEDPWPPYTYGEEGDVPIKGYAVEFLNEISKRIGVKINSRLYPWKRCLHMAEAGDIDGIMLLTKNENREKYIDFTVPIFFDNNLIWFRADSKIDQDFSSFADLKPYRIGITAGFNYGDTFNSARDKYQLKVDASQSIESNFRKLAFNRIDIFFSNMAAASSVLNDDPTLKAKVTYVDKIFEKVPFYVGLSKYSKARALLPEFNRAIEDMLNDGTIDKILLP